MRRRLDHPSLGDLFATTEDIDLGSLGGTLRSGALIQPVEQGNLRGNVVVLTWRMWEDSLPGTPPLIGGWPDLFDGRVERVGDA
jgi:hypothetical protein